MASSLEILNAANSQFLRNAPLTVLNTPPAQSVLNTATTAITWSTPVFDNYTAWAAGSPTRVTPKVAGWYEINGSVGFAANATGVRIAQLAKNGSTNLSQSTTMNVTASFNCVLQIACMVQFNGSTDYVELQADQNSGLGSPGLGILSSLLTSLSVEWIHA
jgi:hypothetical protein